jgi:hypothetical protein
MDPMLTAEAVVSVCGVFRALGKNPKAPSEAELKRSGRLEEDVAKRARELVAMSKPSAQMGPPETPDYREIHKKLTAKIDGGGLSDMLVDVSPELQPACAMVWSNAVIYLDSILPKRIEETMIGPRLNDPSKGELAELAWALRIANTHLIVFDLMADGLLIGPEVGHITSMFPDIHALVCGAIQNALAERSAEDKEWQPPWWLQKQICTLLGVSPVSSSLLADIETAIQDSKKQAQQRGQNIKMNTGLATPAQRLEDR